MRFVRGVPIFLLTAALSVAAVRPAGAVTPEDPVIKQAIEEGILLTVLNDFDSAAVIFRQLIADYPDEPFGYFYLGATCQARMLDREDYREIPVFRGLMQKCIDLGETLREEGRATEWSHFFAGSAYLYISFMDGKLGKLWGAFRNAGKGAGHLEKALARDSTFYDAYLGIGSYKYWKSSKGKALTWLPFFSDERRKGISMVETAVEKGDFVRLVGRDQLAWILLDAGRKDDALQIALENHQEYPQSRFFLWTVTEIYYKCGEWTSATAYYERMLEIVRRLPENNHYNEITCLLRLAEMAMNREAYRVADGYLSALLALAPDEAVSRRTGKKREAARKLKVDCERLLAGQSNGPSGGPAVPVPGADR